MIYSGVIPGDNSGPFLCDETEKPSLYFNLTGQLKAWKEVRDIRDYIQAVESAVIARNGRVDPADGISQWIAWTKNYANSIDPSQREDLGRENEWEIVI